LNLAGRVAVGELLEDWSPLSGSLLPPGWVHAGFGESSARPPQSSMIPCALAPDASKQIFKLGVCP
jgi:hypothetical protein